MITYKQLSNRLSEFIEKSLSDNTLFASTSDFIFLYFQQRIKEK